MPHASHDGHEPLSADSTATALLDMIRQLITELQPHQRTHTVVTLDSILDRDLGLDSLGRAEVLLRLEHMFAVRLPEHLLATVETPRDLLRAIHSTHASEPHLQESTVKTTPRLEMLEAPTAAATLVEVLDWHVQRHPERTHIVLYDDTDTPQDITYSALYNEALAIATGLQAQGLLPGQTVALMLPTSREFFASFYGVLLAGGIPVPLYPPARLSQIEDHLRRQANILSNAAATVLLTIPEAKALGRLLRAHVETLRSVVTVQELVTGRGEYVRPRLQPHDIAFLQYTSGSTGTPKGVILTHANLLANIQAMGQVVQMTSRDVFVSWLPLYHDMGLIGAWLGSLYHAGLLVLMSPLTFLARPARWLWAIHTHRGTLSAGPNFAYDLCTRRLDDHDLQGLDLSSWRWAFNGAEPVSVETVCRFSERFAKYGFPAEAMTPVYGLAEVSLGLAFPPHRHGVHCDRIQREPFMRSGKAIAAAPDDTAALQFVTCGQPLPGYQIRIVDATGYEVAERQEGRLEFQGPSATSGYFRNPAATQGLFHGPWLDSGDLAYVAEGNIYLTGRVKDVIIRAGRNIYPYELEEAIGAIPGLRRGCVAVFGSNDPKSGTERLVVLAETRQTEAHVLEELRRQIDRVVLDLLGTPPDEVVLAPPHTVLKTSSGKIRRTASRERYERGEIGTRQQAPWIQIAHLAFSSVLPQGRRVQRYVSEILYAGYFWMLCGAMLPIAWLLVALLPRRTWCQAVSRTAVRCLLRLSGTAITVEGVEHIPPAGPCILVANHASYLDGAVLVGVLPGDRSFVAKRELAEQFFARVLLQRLGAEFVERFDAQRGADDVKRLLQAAQQGRSLVIFPEGTFYRMPGLQPFRMGAFIVAAQAGVPVVPIAVHGTRSILRAEQWFPRRGKLQVTIGAPLRPQGNDWNAALTLRHAARSHIARHCGEPDLAPASDAEKEGTTPGKS